MKRFLKIILKVFLYGVFALVFWGLGAMGHDGMMKSNEETQKGFVKAQDQEPELLTLAQELELKDIERINFYFHTPESKRSCAEEGSAACYSNSRRKIIFKKEFLSNKEYAKTLMAHEYMHDVWNMKEQAKEFEYIDYLSTLMINHYADSPRFRKMMNWHNSTKHLSANEMFAVACANSPDEILNKEILAECNKYIDRTKFTQQ